MTAVMTDADIDDLVERYRSGETKKQLMTAFGIGHQRFIDALAARGMTTVTQGQRSRKLTDVQAEELAARYTAGETTKQLGAAYGCSGRAVTDYLRRAGVQARPSSHGIVRYAANLTPEERSAQVSANMYRRWANATPEQRAAMLDPAHAAARGVPRTLEFRERVARAREARSGADSAYESMVAQWLTERGADFRQQVAVGPYCADFAVGPVLVEVTTGWARKKEWGERFTRFFDEGWHLYVIWHDTRVPLLPAVADDLVTWAEILQRTPPPGRQHRVVWRSRQVVSCGSHHANYVAGVLRSSAPRGRWPLYDRPGH